MFSRFATLVSTYTKDFTLIMAPNFKSMAEKIGHIFDPIDSFENLTNSPTEKEVVCRFIAIFDSERKSFHNASSTEYSTFPLLAKELIGFWNKNDIFKTATQNSVEDKLRKTLIPKMKLILKNVHQVKTEIRINKIHEDFSHTFELNVSPGRPSPAKRIRKESLQNDVDLENFGKIVINFKNYYL